MHPYFKSYAAKKIRENARNAVAKLRGEDGPEFARVIKGIVRQALSQCADDSEEARPEILRATNRYVFETYGVKPMESDHDRFDFDGKILKWFGVPIARKGMLRTRVADTTDAISHEIADKIERRFGLVINRLDSIGITDALNTADIFVIGNENSARKMAFTRVLREGFLEDAECAGDDTTTFLKLIHNRVTRIRTGMYVFDPGENMPCIYGQHIITWLDRIVATDGSDGITVVDDALVFFVDALCGHVCDIHTQSSPGLSLGSLVINNLMLEPSNQAQFYGDNTDGIMLTVAAYLSNGMDFSDESQDALCLGIFAGSIGRLRLDEKEKIEFLEDLFMATLQYKPRIDPFTLARAILNKPGVPREHRQVNERLPHYLTLVKADRINDTDDVSQVLEAIDQMRSQS
jgi:hypothetical protein